MTAEPSLFYKIKGCMRPEHGGTWHVCFHSMREVCAERDKRIADLERNNEILASRLKKLMEKPK